MCISKESSIVSCAELRRNGVRGVDEYEVDEKDYNEHHGGREIERGDWQEKHEKSECTEGGRGESKRS